MPRLSSPFALDLRSIALFRALLGAILLYDALARLRFATLFLSDDGAFSRADLLATVNRPWSFSLFLMAGEPVQVQALLLLAALAAVALMVGLWTRVAAVACWALLVSVQHRNPIVLNGGDTLFAVYLFWALFLPLNSRWSLDRAFAGVRAEPAPALPAGNRYHAPPGAALVLQVVAVYAFTWLLKTGDLWKSGDAVSFVMRNVSLIREGGVWLQPYEGVQRALTYVTYHWEWLACLLALSPLANGATRLAAVAGMVAMHLGFAWTMDLALFPVVSIAGWLALLPGGFWEASRRVADRFGLSGAAGRIADAARTLPLRGGPVRLPGRLAGACCLAAILAVLVWNVRGLPDSPLRGRFPEPAKNAMYAFKLRQKWSMFAANPSSLSKWYAIEAQLANGDTVDLFHPAKPYSLRRPDRFSSRVPDRRWTKFLNALRKKKYRRLRDDFVERLTERWNRRASPERKIVRAKLVYFRERIHKDRDNERLDPRTLATVWPEGVEQVRRPLAESEEAEEEEDV